MDDYQESSRPQVKRSCGYCKNCNTNVLHIRFFNSRFLTSLDRLSKYVLAKYGLGPWQCVDCGQRGMRLTEPDSKATRTSSDKEDSVAETARVGNFIRADHSLANSADNSDRFTDKYRNDIVERLLAGKSTVSRVCTELHVSELDIQRWIKDYLQIQLDKVAQSQQTSLIPANFAGVSSEGTLNWSQGSDDVIEVNVGRKPR